jgi:nitrate/TMAO reductase-like tetraheme cytochrome c subunit
MKLPLPRNPTSIAGVLFTTLGALFFLIFFLLDVLGLHSNPYMGMLFFLILPGVFIFGLLLIPLGLWRERRRRLAGKGERAWPHIDFNLPRHRNIAFVVMALTFVNVVIVSLAAYSGVHYMDSNEFCGNVCHTVMEPEFSAFQDGPHSRVGCVQCHIGPGAPWFVQAKISGLRQVVAVAAHTYTRPIASPVHNLRPARETCEQCHWPEKFHGDKVKVIREFASDETNTETATTLQVHVGGGSDKLSIATGIHWHMNVANVVEYIATDTKRQVIPWVKSRIDRATCASSSRRVSRRRSSRKANVARWIASIATTGRAICSIRPPTRR